MFVFGQSLRDYHVMAIHLRQSLLMACRTRPSRLTRVAWLVILAIWWLIQGMPISPAFAGDEGGPPSAVNGPPVAASSAIRYAKGFTLEYHDSYKLLRVLTPWREAPVTFTYMLVPRGRKAPPALPGAVVIETPVERIAVTTTTALPFFAMLGVAGKLVGFSGCHRINTPEIAEMFKRHEIAEIGIGDGGMATKLNLERLYVLQPDLVMVYGTGIADFDHHPKLIEAGFRTVVYSNHMEPTPLGRAEWLKFVAAFFDKEREAARLFDGIARSYEGQAERAKEVGRRPTVLHGMAYQGIWYMAGGDGYMARFYADAGADYLWRDDPSRGSMPLTMEAVMERARDAEYWVDLGVCRSLTELRAADDRYRLIQAFRTGRVFNNNAKVGPGGGNDFWETGVARPDLVLADLISVFHPELAPTHERVWYWQLPVRSEEAP